MAVVRPWSLKERSRGTQEEDRGGDKGGKNGKIKHFVFE